MTDGGLKRIRRIYLHTVRKSTHPNDIHLNLLVKIRIRRTPHAIIFSTAPLSTAVHYQKYPDAEKWKDAHKTGLKKLEAEKADIMVAKGEPTRYQTNPTENVLFV